jgi:hypothetical protein
MQLKLFVALNLHHVTYVKRVQEKTATETKRNERLLEFFSESSFDCHMSTPLSISLRRSKTRSGVVSFVLLHAASLSLPLAVPPPILYRVPPKISILE